jgi:hypothetical protein
MTLLVFRNEMAEAANNKVAGLKSFFEKSPLNVPASPGPDTPTRGRAHTVSGNVELPPVVLADMEKRANIKDSKRFPLLF